ncbi:MAG: lactate racemase domain-containing protein [Pirellulaceae bacterium]|nr:DUF2088 domain-containing protein [Planctomycetales bacterium]
MTESHLRFGNDQQIALRAGAHVQVFRTGVPAGEPLDDPEAAVAAALVDPLQYPPLNQATVPGDRIVLALDRDVPQAPAVLSGVIGALLDGVTEPEDITVVTADPQPRGEWFLSLIPPSARRHIKVTGHTPSEPSQLEYLATSRDGQPIYINRLICDADLAIPIGVVKPRQGLGNLGLYSGIFPTFADARTQERFTKPDTLLHPKRLDQRRREVEEAAWLLGARFTVQVIPGGNDTLLHVLAGDVDAVTQDGERMSSTAWDFTIPSKVGLVVAGISGNAQCQNWDNFARTIHAALRIVDDGGAIVVASQIDRHPGPAMQRVVSAMESSARNHAIRNASTIDAVPALQLLEAMQRVRVYLHSGLKAEVVEDLGVGSIGSASEISCLGREYDAWAILENSQYACPHVEQQRATT